MNTVRASQSVATALLIALSACSDPASSIDAPVAIDAAPVAVKVVTCPANPTYKVGVAGHAYDPATQTVPVGSIVKITTSADHSAKSVENLFFVDFANSECVQFGIPATYKFYCTAHGFVGSVTVQ
jgi:BRCT domain type II-containing protein